MLMPPRLALSAATPRAALRTRPGQGRRLVRILQVLMPAAALTVLIALVGTLAYNSIRAMVGDGDLTAGREILTKPRLIGSDDKGRPFVITAASAGRDAQVAQRISLEKPVLVMSGGQPDETRMTAGQGVYDERTGRLEVSAGVKVSGARGAFDTQSSVFDTRTGEILGQGAVRGEGAFGTIQAGSYEGQNNGKRIIYKGGVRARLNMN
jgi:lipopolysaccharide export system protein LptC